MMGGGGGLEMKPSAKSSQCDSTCVAADLCGFQADIIQR